MTAYYNEIDPYCAQWLRNLIAAGLIPAGDVDERPIEEVSADDVKGYTQCHWFAGIGGWAYAARLAGWPDDRPIWTGSCPCQPFSNAGKRLAYDDPRNLWPEWMRLIRECLPKDIVGEQVASRAGRLWLEGVKNDVESIGYELGAADLPAAAVGAPHIRQRIWFVGELQEEGSRISTQVANEKSRAGTRSTCETESRQDRSPVQSGRSHRPVAGADRRGLLRNNWHSFHDGYTALFRQPITGPDRAKQGLYVQQHQGDLFADESSAGTLGREHTSASNGAVVGAIADEPANPTESSTGAATDKRDCGLRIQAQVEGVGRMAPWAAGVGAPHIRARLWWVADAERGAAERHGHEVAGAQSPNQGGEEERQWIRDNARDGGTTGRLGHPQQQGLEGHAGHSDHGHEPGRQPEDARGSTAEAGGDRGLPDATSTRHDGPKPRAEGEARDEARLRVFSQDGGNPWHDAIWIPCADGKTRRIEPGIEPLVDGFPFKMGSGSPLQGKHRVSMVRAYGNAIVPQVAAEFLSAYMETDTGLDGL